MYGANLLARNEHFDHVVLRLMLHQLLQVYLDPPHVRRVILPNVQDVVAVTAECGALIANLHRSQAQLTDITDPDHRPPTLLLKVLR
jgi:hypothetical protein